MFQPNLLFRFSLLAFLAFSLSQGVLADTVPPELFGGQAIADLAEKAFPSVVSLEISVKGKKALPFISENPSDRGSFRVVPKVLSIESRVGDGSGFIISTDGYIATNYHVINPRLNGRDVKASKIEVVLHDNRRFTAEIIGEDQDSDIAVLKIKASNLKPIQFGDSDKLRPGEFAITIGSSLGAEQTVGFGIISGLSQKKPQVSKEALLGDLDYIQTYAQINPGNSGGPLINLNGEVIGITSFLQIAPHSPGFAIPSNYAKRITSALIADGKVRRPAVGIYLTMPRGDLLPIDEDQKLGAFVQEVLEDGPADKAGIKNGDLITKIEGVEIKSPIEFTHEIRTKPVGTTFKIEVYRDKRILNLELKSAYLD
ncbi:MAG: trypsin-like peptidase domain-containing protein [Candidatus Caenarcaniphilales bacterium]|nr:trypsin-like peptidase domain-containing protein [Candidatus Caenarcaniphilales bacterium]